MKVDGVLPFARYLLTKYIHPHAIAIDATCGNGNDTLWLANTIGPKGHVYGFDIQETAIEQTKLKLDQQQVNNVTLFLGSHSEPKSFLPTNHLGKVDVVIFNLGYLPRGNKEITTEWATTLQAIHEMYNLLQINGALVLVVYPGHEQGMLERDILLKYLPTIPQENTHILQYGFINQKNNPPFVIALEKRTNEQLPNLM